MLSSCLQLTEGNGKFPVRDFFVFVFGKDCGSICARRIDRRPALIVAYLTKETRGGVDNHSVMERGSSSVEIMDVSFVGSGMGSIPTRHTFGRER